MAHSPSLLRGSRCRQGAWRKPHTRCGRRCDMRKADRSGQKLQLATRTGETALRWALRSIDTGPFSDGANRSRSLPPFCSFRWRCRAVMQQPGWRQGSKLVSRTALSGGKAAPHLRSTVALTNAAACSTERPVVSMLTVPIGMAKVGNAPAERNARKRSTV